MRRRAKEGSSANNDAPVTAKLPWAQAFVRRPGEVVRPRSGSLTRAVSPVLLDLESPMCQEWTDTGWRACQDSNLGPTAQEAVALSN